ncbi:ATP-dependent helicase [Alkaliphilus pronyensis]|uniref:DNA 3'-5' helicase n=1 Tax=Alkaliphilus pronyensis TaxID=1482732 RepID=A0A6I0F8S4_9FIRM|nr:ATP-dependent helicase [Alkaliphilus pronyensis]KAB3534478.1 ATP-dependent helicase [Alkaliphilus pronyensis]
MSQKNNFLNEKQLKAVIHKDGPCIVYAGPGSGKTTVITHRIYNLIMEYGVAPDNILVISFTKAAAEEMKQRFNKLMDNSLKSNVNFGTFHSIFYRIIRGCFPSEKLNILNEKEKRNVIKNIVRTLEIENSYDEELIKEILQEIGIFKCNYYLQGSFNSNVLDKKDFDRVIDCYEAYKKDHGKIDFDDMLTKCYGALKKEPKLLEYLRRKFKYILIDEFQDINKIQFEIIKMLAQPNNNVFVVGDDDQSIYGFRGANPSFILNFNRIFPNTKRITIDSNYRSQKHIIDAANMLISKNKFRVEKKMECINENLQPLEFYSPANRVEENRLVVEIIADAISRGYSYSDIAVIYRTNLQANGIIDTLIESNLPFVCNDNIDNIFDHWVSRDIISYIRASYNQLDTQSIISIINRPTRYITKKSIKEASQYHKDLITALRVKGGLLPYQLKLINELEVAFKSIRNMKLKDAIGYIRKVVGYDQYISSYCQEKNIPSNGLFDTLDELEEACKKYEDVESLYRGINTLKNESIKPLKNNKDNNCISLLTMHSAKGLEYGVVIIIGAIEAITPHKRSIDSSELLEEERRLFYVAITRAKEQLHIISPKTRYEATVQASRFIEEMKCYDIEKAKLVKGREVVHKLFGKGSIIKVLDNIIKVRFTTNEVRDFDLATCLKNNIFK